MGALPAIKKFLVDDYPSESKWIGTLLYPLNLLLNTVYQNLNNGITFAQNMLGQINTLSVNGLNPTTSFQYNFKSQGNPVAVWIGNIQPAPTSVYSMTWVYNAGTVQVTLQGLPTTGTYSITFLTSGG